MSKRPNPGVDLLPILAAAFPHTFFADPRQVQPLKIDIDRDIVAALPAGITPFQIGRLLYWYVNRPVYQRALAQGQGRIDLTGAVVDAVIPDVIRDQARERWRTLQQQRVARRKEAAGPPDPARRPRRQPPDTPPAAAPTPAFLLNLEELYAMAIDAKLEITLKFSTRPNAKPAGAGKMAFALRTPDGQFITAEVGNKVWAKFTKATEEWPAWMAALTGTMGERTEQGFRLVNPGLQVFERKPKALADSPAPTASASTPAAPAPAEPVAPPAPPPAAPVTVTTGAGTATVTKRNPLSLKRNASTDGAAG